MSTKKRHRWLEYDPFAQGKRALDGWCVVRTCANCGAQEITDLGGDTRGKWTWKFRSVGNSPQAANPPCGALAVAPQPKPLTYDELREVADKNPVFKALLGANEAYIAEHFDFRGVRPKDGR